MIGPLVEYANRPRKLAHVADSVLWQNHHIVGSDHLINAMVDLGIQVVRSAGKYDGFFVMLSGVRDGAFSLRLDITLEGLLFRAGREDRLLDLMFFDSLVFENLIQTRHQTFVLVIRDERMREFYPVFGEDLVHVIGDDLRISGDNRAVIVVLRVLGLQLLIIDARIKDPLFAHLYQSLDVPVHQLSRIAGCIGGDRIHALLVEFLR